MSLKYLLEQRLTTPAQARWLPKLLGYDYTIEYKKGVSNRGADALSRIPEFHFMAISHPCASIWQDIQNEDLRLLWLSSIGYAHFIPLKHPFTAVSVAKEFVLNVVKLHGIPATVGLSLYEYPATIPRDGPAPMELKHAAVSLRLLSCSPFQSRKHREVEFMEGDLVVLSASPVIAGVTVAHARKRTSHKLAPKFFGPYKILKRVGQVVPTAPVVLMIQCSALTPQYMKVCSDESVINKEGKYRPRTEVLIKWVGKGREDATWETKWRFAKAFPDFHLEDKLYKFAAMFEKLMGDYQNLQTTVHTIQQKNPGHPSSSGGGPYAGYGNDHKPYLKLHFSRFSGDDPTAWLYQAEKYFDFQKVPDDDQAHLASLHLEGIALQWHRWFTKSRGPLTWAEFSTALLRRFDGLPEVFLLGCFIGGLKYEIRFEVKIKKPRNLSDAISIARLVENKLTLQRTPSSFPRNVGFNTGLPTTLQSAGLLGPGPTTRSYISLQEGLKSSNWLHVKSHEAKWLCRLLLEELSLNVVKAVHGLSSLYEFQLPSPNGRPNV
ncbi:transposon ty3-G gag-pol polyprotein, partial [Tanacetum coccineum]